MKKILLECFADIATVIDVLSFIYSSMKKIILLAVFASLIFAGCTQTTTTNELDDFAKCLTDK